MMPRRTIVEGAPPTERELDKVLQQFADSLRASDDFIDEGIQLCEKVRLKLQEEVSCSDLPYSIAGTRYAGSVGKRTDVGIPDFDMVILINNHLPPFDDVVQYFQEILRTYSSELQIIPESITETKLKHAAQFKFRNGMEVDLLPATADLTPDDLQQFIRSLQRRKEFSNKDWIRFSTSFVDEQKNFMKSQSGFAHRVVRLSKHWFKSLHFPDKISGGSTIFELLGVEAAMATEDFGGEPMLAALTRVVINASNFDKIKLAFKKDSDGEWMVMSGGDLLPGGQGQVSSIHEDNYILEPSIYVNNILRKMTPETMQLFKEYAGIMEYRLQDFISGRIGVDEVFEPLVLEETVQNAPIPVVAHVVQALSKKKFIHTPGLIIRNKYTTTDEDKLVAEMLINQMVTVVANVKGAGGYNSGTKSGRRKRGRLMTDSARICLETNFPGMMVTEPGDSARMKNFDMVISIPYMTPDAEGYCVMVGLGWGNETLSQIYMSPYC